MTTKLFRTLGGLLGMLFITGVLFAFVKGLNSVFPDSGPTNFAWFWWSAWIIAEMQRSWRGEA